jgi:hypothetical protein
VQLNLGKQLCHFPDQLKLLVLSSCEPFAIPFQSEPDTRSQFRIVNFLGAFQYRLCVTWKGGREEQRRK